MFEIKTFAQLTDVEKSKLVIPAGNEISDYANFQVRYNKKGELIGIKPNDFSAEMNEKVENDDLKPDIIDACQLLNGDKSSRDFRTAFKKMCAYAREN